jgi:hypothetical protein
MEKTLVVIFLLGVLGFFLLGTGVVSYAGALALSAINGLHVALAAYGG